MNIHLLGPDGDVLLLARPLFQRGDSQNAVGVNVKRYLKKKETEGGLGCISLFR